MKNNTMVKITKINDNTVEMDDDGEGLVYPRAMFPDNIKIDDELRYDRTVPEYVHVGE